MGWAGFNFEDRLFGSASILGPRLNLLGLDKLRLLAQPAPDHLQILGLFCGYCDHALTFIRALLEKWSLFIEI